MPTMTRVMLSTISCFAAPFIAACQTTAPATSSPAVLITDDAQSVEILKAALAKAMNKNTVTLGAVALTQRSTISVLPAASGDPYRNPGFNGNNTALPTQFDMMIDAEGCYIVQRSHDDKYRLKENICRKLHS